MLANLPEKLRFYLFAAIVAFCISVLSSAYRWSIGRCVLPDNRLKALVYFSSIHFLSAFVGVLAAYFCLEHLKLDNTATYLIAALTGSVGKDVFELLSEFLYKKIKTITEGVQK